MIIRGSRSLITMVGFVSAMNMNELNNATFWRQHTFQVILEAQTFNDDLMDMQRGLRGYVSTDDTNSRATYQNDRKLETEQFNKLVELTSDNPAQTKQLKSIAAAANEMEGLHGRAITMLFRDPIDPVFERNLEMRVSANQLVLCHLFSLGGFAHARAGSHRWVAATHCARNSTRRLAIRRSGRAACPWLAWTA